MKPRLWLWRLLWPWRAGAAPAPASGEAFPDFTLKDLEGVKHSLFNAEPGARTVLWLTNFCEDCRARVPLLEELRREASDRCRILAVSILSIDDPLPGQVAPSCGFPILLDPEDVVTKKLGQAHPPGTCPLRNLYIVDGAGRILFRHHLSALKPDAFRAAWRALIAGGSE